MHELQITLTRKSGGGINLAMNKAARDADLGLILEFLADCETAVTAKAADVERANYESAATA